MATSSRRPPNDLRILVALATTKSWVELNPGVLSLFGVSLARPGALTAALNWYRANAPPSALVGPVPNLPPVRVPVLGVSADGDAYLTESNLKNSHEKVVGRWKYLRMEGVSHWLMLDRPEGFSRLLSECLAE